jgi:hypothetical protein
MHRVFVYWTDTPEALAKCLDTIVYAAKEPLSPVRHLSSILVIAYHCSGWHLRANIMRRSCNAAQHILGPDTQAQCLNGHGPSSSQHTSRLWVYTGFPLTALLDNTSWSFFNFRSFCSEDCTLSSRMCSRLYRQSSADYRVVRNTRY